MGSYRKICWAERIRECVAIQCGLCQHLTLDDAYIRINASIPNHSKDILDTTFPDILKEVVSVINVDNMILDHFFKVLTRKMGLKLLPCWHRKIDVPRDIWRIFPLQSHLHYGSFIHLYTPEKKRIMRLTSSIVESYLNHIVPSCLFDFLATLMEWMN